MIFLYCFNRDNYLYFENVDGKDNKNYESTIRFAKQFVENDAECVFV